LEEHIASIFMLKQYAKQGTLDWSLHLGGFLLGFLFNPKIEAVRFFKTSANF
jgi:hypothetical protein